MERYDKQRNHQLLCSPNPFTVNSMAASDQFDDMQDALLMNGDHHSSLEYNPQYIQLHKELDRIMNSD